MTSAFVLLVVAVLGAASSAALVATTAATPRGRRARWVVAIGAVLPVAVAASSDVPVAAVVAAVGLVAAAVVDAVELRIPARLAIGTAVVSSGALVGHALWSSSWDLVGDAALGTAIVVLVFGVMWLAGGMGYGDVRLAAAATPSAAAAAGVAGALALLWGAFVAAGVTALVLRLTSRRRAPAGAPALAVTPAGESPAPMPSSDQASLRPSFAVPFGPAILAGWLLAVVAT
jgi:hypothetical protein